MINIYILVKWLILLEGSVQIIFILTLRKGHLIFNSLRPSDAYMRQ